MGKKLKIALFIAALTYLIFGVAVPSKAFSEYGAILGFLTFLGYIIELCLDLFLLTLMISLVAVPLFFLCRKVHRNGGQKAAMRVAVVSLIVFGLIYAGQLYSEARLMPLKAKFTRIARHHSYSYEWGTGGEVDGHPINSMDFGGALDKVVKERDQKIRSIGFAPLAANWRAGDSRMTTCINVCVFWPF
jgi:hypothetical protein